MGTERSGDACCLGTFVLQQHTAADWIVCNNLLKSPITRHWQVGRLVKPGLCFSNSTFNAVVPTLVVASLVPSIPLMSSFISHRLMDCGGAFVAGWPHQGPAPCLLLGTELQQGLWRTWTPSLMLPYGPSLCYLQLPWDSLQWWKYRTGVFCPFLAASIPVCQSADIWGKSALGKALHAPCCEHGEPLRRALSAHSRCTALLAKQRT